MTRSRKHRIGVHGEPRAHRADREFVGDRLRAEIGGRRA